MENIHQKIYADLGFVIEYKGKKFNQISLSGFPLEGEISLYEQLKEKIGFDLLFNGNPEINLDEQTINDLQIEVNCYKLRSAILNNFISPLRSIEDIIYNVDNAIAITRVIKNQAADPSKREKANSNLKYMNIALKRFLSEYYLSNENYMYAEKLARECLEHLTSVDYEKEIVKKTEEYGEYIDSYSRLNHKGRWNLLPDSSPNPKSLAALLEKAEAEKSEEMTRKYKLKISLLKRKIKDVNPDFFIKYLSSRLLEKIVQEGCISQIQKNRIDIYELEDITQSKIMLNQIVSAYQEEEKKIIEVVQSKLLPEKIFHLVNEDQYVMLFGRFNIEIRVFKRKRIVNLPYTVTSIKS